MVWRLKGLFKYLLKHGGHFTEELAIDAIHCRWNPFDVMNTTQRLVYYNVTGATVGDIVYLMNKAAVDCHRFHPSKIDCAKKALFIVGDYKGGRCYAFKQFIKELNKRRQTFEFYRYV